MVLFEIHQWSKGHFMNELGVSFNIETAKLINAINNMKEKYLSVGSSIFHGFMTDFSVTKSHVRSKQRWYATIYCMPR